MDVIGLENATEVGLVRRARAQASDGGFLVAESFKEGIGEVRAVERLFRKVGYCLFNLDGVQLFAPRHAQDLKFIEENLISLFGVIDQLVVTQHLNISVRLSVVFEKSLAVRSR